jgi:hypothetical protein
VVRRAPRRRRGPRRAELSAAVVEEAEARHPCPVLHGDQRLHAAQGVGCLAPHQLAASQRLQLHQPAQRAQSLPRKVGPEDGLDLDRRGVLDADDDGGALGRRHPEGRLLRRLGRGRGGDGDGVLVRVHMRLHEPAVRLLLPRRRAPKAPPPLLLGPWRGRRRRRTLVRLRSRRERLVLAPPAAGEEVPEPPARLAHHLVQNKRNLSLMNSTTSSGSRAAAGIAGSGGG